MRKMYNSCDIQSKNSMEITIQLTLDLCFVNNTRNALNSN